MTKVSPISNLLLDEYKNIGVFYPISLIFGILIGYTQPHFNPYIFFTLYAITGCSFLFRRYHPIRTIGLFLFFFLTGILSISHRMETVQSPALENPMDNVELIGQIESTENIEEGQRIILKSIRFLNHNSYAVPEKIKLKFFQREPIFTVGDIIHANVFLRPPLKPIAPYAYNEARTLYFQKIGAVGRIKELKKLQQSDDGVATIIDTIRQTIKTRIFETTPKETAQIAVALTIGEQSDISQHLYQIFRSSGIIHILSVSGFHLSLLSFFVFLLIRFVLACIPAVSERIDTKKIAAIFSLICAGLYICISGMQIPAIRSLIMIAVFLIALMFNRNALSLRSLSIACILILIPMPEMIFNIGFQLSFLAVLILVTLYDTLKRKLTSCKEKSILYHFYEILIGFILLDVLMILTMSPVIVYHFNQYPIYGFLGNILTGIIISFWIMPMLFIALVLMPFGADSLFFKLSAVGLEYIIIISEKIDKLPYALISFSSFDSISLIIICLGIFTLCMGKKLISCTGIGIILIGLYMCWNNQKPDLLIGDNGLTIAIRNKHGNLDFLTIGPNDYFAQNWLFRNGENKKISDIKEKGLPNSLTIKGKSISFSSDTCYKSDICFLPTDDKKYDNALPLYDFSVRAVYIQGNKIEVKTNDTFF